MRSRSGPESRRAVALDLTGGAAARPDGVALVAARAGVHRRHQHEAGGENSRARRAGDRDPAVLQRLAQDLEDPAIELRHLVEEQHAVVREANFAGARELPPPTSATSEIVWCGARNGRSASRPIPGGSRPQTEWMAVHSSDSSKVSGGRMPGSRLAIIVLPAPGGPIIRMLWPPAAATSSARRASPWPRTSEKSTGHRVGAGSDATGRARDAARLR